MQNAKSYDLTPHIVFCCCAALTFVVGCGLTELKDREGLLRAMCATNASLEVIESRIGHIPVFSRGTQQWDSLRAVYARHQSPKYQRMLSKLERSAAVGFTTTTSLQTFIFLDAQHRLTDFDVDSQ